MWCKKKKKVVRPYRRAIQYPIEACEVPMHDVHSTKEERSLSMTENYI